MVDSAQKTKAGEEKIAIGFFSGHGDGTENGRLDQEQAFFLFCERQGYRATATFSANASSSDGYPDMFRYVRQHNHVETLVLHDLESLSKDHVELSIRLLELNELNLTIRLVNGETIDPYKIVCGSRGRDTSQTPDMRERIKTAMRNRAIKGEGLGKPPYGYRIGQDRKLEAIPEESAVVLRIFRLYTQENQGIRLIVRHLNENNISTRKGRNWSMVTIRDILRNRNYLGTYTRFGLRVPGSHQAIINPDMFRWAQAKLQERRPTRKDVQSEPFLLSGLATCAACGNRMVGVTRRQSWTRRKDGSRVEQQYRYYQCQSRTNQGVCNYHTRKAEQLEADVRVFLHEQRDRLADTKPTRTVGSPAAVQRTIRRLEVAHGRTDGELRKNIRQVRRGKLSIQRFRSLNVDLLQTRLELQSHLEALRDGRNSNPSLSTAHQAVQDIDTLSEQWNVIEFSEKKALIQKIVARIDVHDDRFDVQLKAGLEDTQVTS